MRRCKKGMLSRIAYIYRQKVDSTKISIHTHEKNFEIAARTFILNIHIKVANL
jgi:hypothetical protein